MHRNRLVCPIRHLLQLLPAGSFFIHTQGTRARLRLRTGMGLGMLAWVYGRALAANNTVRPVIFPSSLLSHLAPATIADKPRPPGTDPQHLRSRRQGYHEAWAAKRQEAAAAANSPDRVEAAAAPLPHEKPQLYAVDVDQCEDLAHEFAAAEPSMPTSLAVELAHLSLASGIARGALQLQAISTFEVSDAYQCICCAAADPANACV